MFALFRVPMTKITLESTSKLYQCIWYFSVMFLQKKSFWPLQFHPIYFKMCFGIRALHDRWPRRDDFDQFLATQNSNDQFFKANLSFDQHFVHTLTFPISHKLELYFVMLYFQINSQLKNFFLALMGLQDYHKIVKSTVVVPFSKQC